MGKFVAVIGVIFLSGLGVGFTLFIGSIMGTAFGAMGGWFVGLVFDDTLYQLTQHLGLGDTPPWQLGAMLGFVGGFFRSSISK